jgi:hypothetical protein
MQKKGTLSARGLNGEETRRGESTMNLAFGRDVSFESRGHRHDKRVSPGLFHQPGLVTISFMDSVKRVSLRIWLSGVRNVPVAWFGSPSPIAGIRDARTLFETSYAHRPHSMNFQLEPSLWRSAANSA